MDCWGFMRRPRCVKEVGVQVPPPTPPEPQHEAFWQSCCSARSVAVVEVNGYTIEPGANLTWANLKGARLDPDRVRVHLGEANFRGARANEDTRWPAGFDPVAAGVIFQD